MNEYVNDSLRRLIALSFFFSGISRVRGVEPRTFIVLDRLYGTLGDKIVSWTEDVKRLSTGLFATMRNKKELDVLWNERLLAMYDIARAMKYLHSLE